MIIKERMFIFNGDIEIYSSYSDEECSDDSDDSDRKFW